MKLSVLVLCVTLGVFANCQVFFGNKKETEDVTNTRLGLLAESLGKHPVSGNPVGGRETANFQSSNGGYTNCRCVRKGQCGGGSQQVNTDGAGLIDVRIVNRPAGTCQSYEEYCCSRPGSYGGGNTGGNNGGYPGNTGGNNGGYPGNTGGNNGGYPGNNGGNTGGNNGGYPGSTGGNNGGYTGNNGAYTGSTGGNNGAYTGNTGGNNGGRTSRCSTSSNPNLQPSCPRRSYGFDERNYGLHQTNIGTIQGYTHKSPDAEFGEYPWVCVLLNHDNSFVGHAALVGFRHAITTAHTVQNKYKLKIRCGEWDASDNYEPCSCWETNIVKSISHQYFSRDNLHNNIAVLTLQVTVPNIYPHISPISLPQPRANYAGQRCWVAGFGKDGFGSSGRFQHIMKEVDLPIIHSRQCENQLKRTKLGYDFVLHRSFLCAGGEAGKDSCEGDRGAALTCRGRNGRFEVAGLVSWGIDCAQQGIPGVYVDVSKFSSWIRQQLY